MSSGCQSSSTGTIGLWSRFCRREDYWVAGITEYWIADPRTEAITVSRRGPQSWVAEVLDRPEQRLRTPQYPEFEMRLGSLFGC